jgi:hypothetical protein
LLLAGRAAYTSGFIAVCNLDGEGAEIGVPRGRFEVAAMVGWLELAEITAGPLFRKDGRIFSGLCRHGDRAQRTSPFRW